MCGCAQVITLDGFLSDEEADAILAAGSAQGTDWSRSMAGDGVQVELDAVTIDRLARVCA